jgi:hypothetical protein
MNLQRQILQHLVLLLIACSPVPTSHAQQLERQARAGEKKYLSYGFVSPNTREDLKLHEAIKKLNSAEEIRLMNEIRMIGCRVGLKVRMVKALGSWSHGAEHSTIFRVRAGEATMRYAVSLLGKYANQKAVLYFRRSNSGNARLYILYPERRSRNLFIISRALDRAGVRYRTLVPLKQVTVVYIVDHENELQTKLAAVARRLRARVTSVAGTGIFIGDDTDRAKGQRIFNLEIEKYENAHPELPPQCPKKASIRISTRPAFQFASNRYWRPSRDPARHAGCPSPPQRRCAAGDPVRWGPCCSAGDPALARWGPRIDSLQVLV